MPENHAALSRCVEVALESARGHLETGGESIGRMAALAADAGETDLQRDLIVMEARCRELQASLAMTLRQAQVRAERKSKGIQTNSSAL